MVAISEKPVESTRPQEVREGEPLKGRVILITAGATGTGLETARTLHSLGAEIVIGTRSYENYQKAAAQLERVQPFVADLTDSQQVDDATKYLRGEDMMLTDVILSAAGGIEGFMRSLMAETVRLKAEKKRNDGVVPDREFETAREKIGAWVVESLPAAFAINFHAKVNLIHKLQKGGLLREGGSLIDYSSLQASFIGDPDPQTQELAGIPLFYSGVATSKGAHERWLLNQRKELQRQGTTATIISGDIIGGTNVARVIEKFMMPLYPDEGKGQPAFISMEDMIHATVDTLQNGPDNAPARVFVISPGFSSPMDALRGRQSPL